MAAQDSPGAVTEQEASARRPSGRRTPRLPENAIQAGRARRAGRAAPKPAAPSAVPEDPRSNAGKIPRADTDPWTVPESVRDRFVQDGHRFYFHDGHPAFRDLGRKLTTVSENTQVVHSLIEIARARGWNEITVSGTERFREDAWRQARLAGLSARGFKPTEEQQAQLVRAMARTRREGADRVDAVSEGPPSVPPEETPAERITGRLLDHGRDAYRHDPKREPSYFVELETSQGRREIWGRDLERAVKESLTQPKVGDEVILQRLGQEPVTIKRPEKQSDGALREREVEVFRNRWRIETEQFFAQRTKAADLVKDDRVAPQDAVREHPELAGTYLSLRAAELAAQALRDPQDQRRFVSSVRQALADSIRQGEPLQPIRLRERARTSARGERVQEDLEQVRG